MNQNEQDWLDTLAGYPPTHRKPPALAADLRRVILRQKAPPHDPQGLARLLFRLQGEGLLSPPRPVWQRVLPLAASVLFLALLMPALLTTPPAPPDISQPKGFVMPQEIQAAQPQATAQALLASLHALGLAATLREQDGAWIVQSPLPQPPPPALAKRLRGYGLMLLPQTELLVVIRPPTAQP